MPIKFIAIRTQDGKATDPMRTGAKVKAGVSGRVEVLATGPATAFRVTVDGASRSGAMPVWPSDLPAGTHAVIVEQVNGENVVDTKTGSIDITE